MCIKHTCISSLLLRLGCVPHYSFTDAMVDHCQNMLYCSAPLSCAFLSTLLCAGNSGPTLMSCLEVRVRAERKQRRYILSAAASWYYEAAVMWNWILSQNSCLRDYVPALAIRVLQAGRIQCSVKSDATSSPIQIFLNKLEQAVWLIPVHIVVTFFKQH